jgi:hypothetical protein
MSSSRDKGVIHSPLLGNLAEDQLPEEASVTKPYYTKFLLNIKVLIFEENFFLTFLFFLGFDYRINV